MFKGEISPKPVYQINEERFNRHLAFRISDADCWIWATTFFKRENGTKLVPKFTVLDPGTRKPKTVYARRWAWEMAHGHLPSSTAVVNVCGEDRCVKPDIKHNRPVQNGYWVRDPEGQEAVHGKASSEGFGQGRSGSSVPSEDEFLNK